jgi:hypothetical protein
MNVRQVPALNVSVIPSRSVVSRTQTTPGVPATSTQLPPLSPEYDDLRHVLCAVVMLCHLSYQGSGL